MAIMGTPRAVKDDARTLTITPPTGNAPASYDSRNYVAKNVLVADTTAISTLTTTGSTGGVGTCASNPITANCPMTFGIENSSQYTLFCHLVTTEASATIGPQLTLISSSAATSPLVVQSLSVAGVGATSPGPISHTNYTNTNLVSVGGMSGNVNLGLDYTANITTGAIATQPATVLELIYVS
jgi:hypothetical protein